MLITHSYIQCFTTLAAIVVSLLFQSARVSAAGVLDEPDDIPKALYAALLDDTRTLQELRYQQYGTAISATQDIVLLEFATSVNVFGEENLLSEADIALSHKPDRETKLLIKYARSRHELHQIRILKKQIFYQTWASFFNLLSSSSSNLINGQTAVLGELGLNSVYRFCRPRSPSAREKRLHFLFSIIERKGWDLPVETHEKFRCNIEKIERHIDEDRYRKNLRKSRFYMEHGTFETADFYLDRAYSENDTFKTYRHILENARGERERRRLTNQAVSDSRMHIMSNKEKGCLRSLLASLLICNERNLEELKVSFLMCFGSEEMATLEFIEAVRHTAGIHPTILADEMHGVSRKYAGSLYGCLAEGLLHTEYINPYRYYAERKNEYSADVWRYIMTGERSLDEQAYIASSIAIHYARNLASNLGAFFIFDVFIRGIKTAVENPVDTTEVKYAAQRYLALSEVYNPFPPEKYEVAEWLADVYKRDHEYGLAEQYYEKAGILTPRLKKNLRETAANDLYRMALAHESADVKKSLLRGILEHYADTPSAPRAEKELASIIEGEKILITIPYETLKEYPFIGEECGLLQELWDGEENNGEISDKGLVIHETGTIYFEDRTSGIVLSDTIEKETSERIVSWWKDSSIRNGNIQQAGDALRRRKFPVEIVGSAGSGGFDLYPRLLPLPSDASLDLFK